MGRSPEKEKKRRVLNGVLCENLTVWIPVSIMEKIHPLPENDTVKATAALSLLSRMEPRAREIALMEAKGTLPPEPGMWKTFFRELDEGLKEKQDALAAAKGKRKSQ
jgi:hypothetical protein